MKNLSNWVQLLGVVGVLAGLALVIIELRQAKELAVIQISSDSFTYSQQLDALLVGENLATTMARITDPKAQLTTEDLYIYDGYAFSKITLTSSVFGPGLRSSGVKSFRKSTLAVNHPTANRYCYQKVLQEA